MLLFSLQKHLVRFLLLSFKTCSSFAIVSKIFCAFVFVYLQNIFWYVTAEFQNMFFVCDCLVSMTTSAKDQLGYTLCGLSMRRCQNLKTDIQQYQTNNIFCNSTITTEQTFWNQTITNQHNLLQANHSILEQNALWLNNRTR